MEKIKLFIIICILITSCAKKSNEINQDLVKQKVIEISKKYNLKQTNESELKNIKNIKMFSSIDELETELKKFDDRMKNLDYDNTQVEKFTNDLKKLGNFTQKQHFDLVDKYPVVKNQLIAQFGDISKYNQKVSSLLQKEQSENSTKEK